MDKTTAGGGLNIPLPAFPSLTVDCRSVIPDHLALIVTSDYIKIVCPFHDDTTPSCAVYAESYYCYACNASGKALSLYMALHEVSRDQAIEEINTGNFPVTQIQPKKEYKLPKQSLALELHHNLDDAAMEYYIYDRGLFPETIAQYQLGWGSLYTGGVLGYTIPIYRNNKLRQIKLRIPNESQDKYRSVSGAGSWLYLGEDVAYQDQVIICGGEFDALVLRQNGYIATAPTSGEKRFDPSWVQAFEGTTPYCAYDNDEAGEAGYQKLKKIFNNKIKRIRLPVKDITEYFLKYENFDQHIADANTEYSLWT